MYVYLLQIYLLKEAGGNQISLLIQGLNLSVKT